ncbi:MAG: exodeoxyribonuclease VII small subunit [Bdellovibrio sp.]|nr:exodeoxyribonuclease VII small subunit [Methylotenera sp.]
MTAKLQPETTPNFEATIAELESIVAQMESGNLPLDESINAYKRGAALLQTCQQSLASAEQQVRILTEANKLVPFNPSDD